MPDNPGGQESQFAYHFEKLFTKPDSVTLADEDYSIERVGNNEDRQRRAGEMEFVSDFVVDVAFDVCAPYYGRRHVFEFACIKSATCFFVFEEEEYFSSPFFKSFLAQSYVA